MLNVKICNFTREVHSKNSFRGTKPQRLADCWFQTWM